MRARVLGILFAIGAIATPTHAQDTAGGRVSVLGSATRVAAPVAATPVPQQNLPPSVPPAFADPEGTEQPGSVSAVPATVHAEGASTLAVIDGPPPLIAPDVIARDEAGRATIRAIKLAQGIRLDGQLDEQVYESVPPVTDFIQQLPDEGAPGTDKDRGLDHVRTRPTCMSLPVGVSAPERVAGERDAAGHGSALSDSDSRQSSVGCEARWDAGGAGPFS